jgi:hypothetical protein
MAAIHLVSAGTGGLEANLDRAAEQGWRYSDAGWVRAHRRGQATGGWLPL